MKVLCIALLLSGAAAKAEESAWANNVKGAVKYLVSTGIGASTGVLVGKLALSSLSSLDVKRHADAILLGATAAGVVYAGHTVGKDAVAEVIGKEHVKIAQFSAITGLAGIIYLNTLVNQTLANYNNRG